VFQDAILEEHCCNIKEHYCNIKEHCCNIKEEIENRLEKLLRVPFLADVLDVSRGEELQRLIPHHMIAEKDRWGLAEITCSMGLLRKALSQVVPVAGQGIVTMALFVESDFLRMRAVNIGPHPPLSFPVLCSSSPRCFLCSLCSLCSLLTALCSPLAGL
jgi:hypothetical protein